ncbi:MAG: pirin family protein [Pseudomonadota bacterium]
MNAITTAIGHHQDVTPGEVALVSEPLTGNNLSIGPGFDACSFRAQDIGEAMDPLVMVDHYVMTQPTFGAHPHAGMSAVSLLLEDSEGLFHNQDSLGNDFDLRPGDLYWLSAGRGAVHDESPRVNARTHGLQVFVNVPQIDRFAEPSSLLVRSEEMPVINTVDCSVKVALGESNGVRGAVSPSTQMNILVGSIQPGGSFQHGSIGNRGIWVQSMKGVLEVAVAENTRHLPLGQAVAAKTSRSEEINITNRSSEPVHFVLFDGARIAETYVQDGPFVMGTEEQIADIKAAYEAGELGSLAGNY